MNFISSLYNLQLVSNGLQNRFWQIIRKIAVILFKDPSCCLLIHGRMLTIPLSHELPVYLKNNKYYDRLPRRVGDHLRRKHGQVIGIDVGANVGDSIAAFDIIGSDQYLAIEPNPKFYSFLKTNWGHSENVETLEVICSADSEISSFEFQEKKGTASVLKSTDGARIRSRTLDSVILELPAFSSANLIKIDTDGQDFEVISGAKRLIETAKPWVLFECAHFGSESYVSDCLDSLDFFFAAGYNRFLLYDNFGSLMGKHSLSDLSSLQNLLFFQLTSPFLYFDILVIPEDGLDSFIDEEFAFFAHEIVNPQLRKDAEARLLRE